jgi:PST family polysaccharide transporter
LKLKVTRNAIWLTACRATGDFLNLLLFVIISRAFGPAGVGEYSYGFAVASFVFVVGCLGIEEYGLRQYARMQQARRAPFIAELLGAQAIMVVVAIVGLAVYLLLTAPKPTTLVIVVLLAYYQVAVAVAATLFIPAMAEQRMAQPAVSDLVTRALAFAVAGAAIRFGHLPLPLTLLGFPVAGTVLLVLAVRSARPAVGGLRVSLSRTTFVAIVGVLWSFALIEIFVQLLSRVGIIALTLKLGEAPAGVFAAGLRLIDVALMPLAFIGLAAYPRLSQLYITDAAAFRGAAAGLLWYLVLVSGGVAWGLYFVAPELLVPVLGVRFAGAEPVVRMMAAVAVMQALELVLGRLLFAADRQVVRAAGIIAGALSSVVLNLVLIPQLGVSGAVVAGVCSYTLIAILYAGALRKPLSGAGLSVPIGTLAAALTVGAGAAWLAIAQGSPRWVPAAAAAIAFCLIAGAGYGYAHGRARRAPAAAAQL